MHKKLEIFTVVDTRTKEVCTTTSFAEAADVFLGKVREWTPYIKNPHTRQAARDEVNDMYDVLNELTGATPGHTSKAQLRKTLMDYIADTGWDPMAADSPVAFKSEQVVIHADLVQALVRAETEATAALMDALHQEGLYGDLYEANKDRLGGFPGVNAEVAAAAVAFEGEWRNNLELSNVSEDDWLETIEAYAQKLPALMSQGITDYRRSADQFIREYDPVMASVTGGVSRREAGETPSV
jgi:hypothetical protein